MEIILTIKKILEEKGKIKVLDLGAGKGYYSLFCASYGADVVAVDNKKNKFNLFPDYLLNHPKISFVENDVQDFLKRHNEKYQLIFLLNVLPFLDKNFVKNKIFFYLANLLSDNGNIVFSFFLSNDETMKEKVNTYDMEEFDFLGEIFEIIKQSDFEISEDHKPYGKHNHHIGYYVLGKKKK